MMGSAVPAGNIDRLTTLPNEILDIILAFTDVEGLLAPSLAHRQLRQLALLRIYLHFFRARTLTFSVTSFQNLVRISQCPHLAPLVHVIRYQVPLFLKKELLNYQSFTKILETRAFSLRLHSPNRWPHPELPENYSEAYSHTAEQYRAQASILASGADTQSLAIALPHLVNLSEFCLDIYTPQVYGGRDPEKAHEFVDPPEAACVHHLHAVMEVFRSANSQPGVTLKTFATRGHTLCPLPETQPHRQALYSGTFSGITKLRLHYRERSEWLFRQSYEDTLHLRGYYPIFEYSATTLTSLEMRADTDFLDSSRSDLHTICKGLVFPRLEELKLVHSELDVEVLVEFFRTCAPNLRKLTFVNTWFQGPEQFEDEGNMIVSENEQFIQHLRALEQIGHAIEGLLEAVYLDRFYYDRGNDIGLNRVRIVEDLLEAEIGSNRVRTFERLLKKEIGWREASTLVKAAYVREHWVVD